MSSHKAVIVEAQDGNRYYTQRFHQSPHVGDKMSVGNVDGTVVNVMSSDGNVLAREVVREVVKDKEE